MNLFKFYKNFESEALKHSVVNSSKLLEELRIILRGEIMENLDFFIFDKLSNN